MLSSWTNSQGLGTGFDTSIPYESTPWSILYTASLVKAIPVSACDHGKAGTPPGRQEALSRRDVLVGYLLKLLKGRLAEVAEVLLDSWIELKSLFED